MAKCPHDVSRKANAVVWLKSASKSTEEIVAAYLAHLSVAISRSLICFLDNSCLHARLVFQGLHVVANYATL